MSCGPEPEALVSRDLEEEAQTSSPILRQAGADNESNALALEALRNAPPLTDEFFEKAQADFERSVDETLQGIDPTEERAARLVAQAEAKRDAEFQKEVAERKAQEAAIAEDSPSLGTSLVPVVGSGLEAKARFKHGDIAGGILFAGLAVSDVFLVKALAVGGGHPGWHRRSSRR
jgi:hypothetical protein